MAAVARVGHGRCALLPGRVAPAIPSAATAFATGRAARPRALVPPSVHVGRRASPASRKGSVRRAAPPSAFEPGMTKRPAVSSSVAAGFRTTCAAKTRTAVPGAALRLGQRRMVDRSCAAPTPGPAFPSERSVGAPGRAPTVAPAAAVRWDVNPRAEGSPDASVGEADVWLPGIPALKVATLAARNRRVLRAPEEHPGARFAAFRTERSAPLATFVAVGSALQGKMEPCAAETSASATGAPARVMRSAAGVALPALAPRIAEASAPARCSVISAPRERSPVVAPRR